MIAAVCSDRGCFPRDANPTRWHPPAPASAGPGKSATPPRHRGFQRSSPAVRAGPTMAPSSQLAGPAADIHLLATPGFSAHFGEANSPAERVQAARYGV